jgi:hypothetical protein
MPPLTPTSQVGDSPRVPLAHVALAAALSVAGVEGAEAGPRGSCLTDDPPAGVLRGIAVIAQADGRYSVDLCLVAGIVPLIELAAEVRRRVQARVAREGLADQLGDINVQFSAVRSADEIAARSARELAAQAEARGAAAAGAEHADPAPRPQPEEQRQ